MAKMAAQRLQPSAPITKPSSPLTPKIKGDKVEVTSKEVSKPAAVR